MANSNGWGDGAANNAIGWGQGANNNIGWGDSHAKSNAGLTDIVGLTTDSDAQAFITAAAITDATQQSAIDTLVKGLKTDGIWTKMKAIYPFVGGTATTHKWNLKDPRDLDAAFRLVFNGGWTHSSTGATPNGTNGYADTKLVPSSVLSQNSSHLSFYSRTLNTTNQMDMGALPSSFAYYLLLMASDGTAPLSGINSTPNNGSGNSQAYFIGNRNSSTVQSIFRNATKTDFTSLSINTPAFALSIGAANIGGTVQRFSNRQTAFTSIGDGLTDTEASNLYSRVQTYQNSLNRAV